MRSRTVGPPFPASARRHPGVGWSSTRGLSRRSWDCPTGGPTPLSGKCRCSAAGRARLADADRAAARGGGMRLGRFNVPGYYVGDCRALLAELPDESVNCVVTSPPYWGLRDYGVEGQLGLEETPEAYVAAMVDVFREVRRVVRSDGTAWVNLGDSYASSSTSDHQRGKATP